MADRLASRSSLLYSSISRVRARHSGAPATLQLASVRCVQRRLGSRALGRLWRYVAPRATFRQDRALSQAAGRDIGGLPRSHLRRLLPSLADVAFTPLPRLRAEHVRSFEKGEGSPPTVCEPNLALESKTADRFTRQLEFERTVSASSGYLVRFCDQSLIFSAHRSAGSRHSGRCIRSRSFSIATEKGKTAGRPSAQLTITSNSPRIPQALIFSLSAVLRNMRSPVANTDPSPSCLANVNAETSAKLRPVPSPT